MKDEDTAIFVELRDVLGKLGESPELNNNVRDAINALQRSMMPLCFRAEVSKVGGKTKWELAFSDKFRQAAIALIDLIRGSKQKRRQTAVPPWLRRRRPDLKALGTTQRPANRRIDARITEGDPPSENGVAASTSIAPRRPYRVPKMPGSGLLQG